MFYLALFTLITQATFLANLECTLVTVWVANTSSGRWPVCVCQVTQENGLNRFIRFVVIFHIRKNPYWFLVFLCLLNRIASLGEKCPKAEALLERGGVPDRSMFFKDLVFSKDMRTTSLKAGPTPHAVATHAASRYRIIKKSKINWKTLGVIEEVTQPTEWVSPIVVRCTQTEWRCQNMCRLWTSQSLSQTRTLPTSDCRGTVCKDERSEGLYKPIDASSGFWQIPLAYESSEQTTFLTPFGRFGFTRIRARKYSTELCRRYWRELTASVTCYIDDARAHLGDHPRGA